LAKVLLVRHQFYINTREPLELEPKSTYCFGVMKRWGYLRAVLVLGTLLLAVGLATSIFQVRRFREFEYAKFRDKSIQLTGVFARAAGAWIARGQLAVVQSMADLTLAGSGQYVWIQFEDEVLLDRRIDDPAVSALDLSTESGLEETTIASSFRDGGLDIVYPLNLPAQAKVVAGAVRIGFLDSAAARVVRRQSILVFSLTVGSWIAVLLVAILLVRALALRRRLAREVRVTEPGGVIRVGDLSIDTDSYSACLGARRLI
jgi:hypothetical protein